MVEGTAGPTITLHSLLGALLRGPHLQVRAVAVGYAARAQNLDAVLEADVVANCLVVVAPWVATDPPDDP